MANHKKYSLLVSQILFVVQNFVNERNEISLEFKKKSNLFRFELSDLKEKKPGILLYSKGWSMFFYSIRKS